MAKFEYKPDDVPKEKQSRQGLGPCAVHGCPRMGHIFAGNWNCRYHYGKAGINLSRVTVILRNHNKEFDWYETLLAATPVDFLMGDIARLAPPILEVQEKETWWDYKRRVKAHVDHLLSGGVVK